ncbi:DUF6221 family protein [Microtetraspora malaysiensis]|uniref:DUF6221 family protein n=1 Tax=Microtetraspora malaysiensis TaxID=161358 RepID=UPI003D905B69
MDNRRSCARLTSRERFAPDPARVLADLAAKQDRLKYLAHVAGGSRVDAGEHAQAEHLLRLKAAAYDWHEDYRPEWRP